MSDPATPRSGQRWRAISDGRVLLIVAIAAFGRGELLVNYDDTAGTFVLSADELVYDFEVVEEPIATDPP